MSDGFKIWLETKKDIFGFDKKYRIRCETPNKNPFKQVKIEEIISELVRHEIGIKQPKKMWSHSNAIIWGETTGSIKVEVFPASFCILVQKKIEDLTGIPVWITKSAYDLRSEAYGQEGKVIDHLLEYCQEIDNEMTEMPNRDYQGLEKLTIVLAKSMNQNKQEKFMFKGIKKLKENNYMVSWQMAMHGVEAPSQRRVEQFSLNTSFNKDTGLIHIWAYDIRSKVGGPHSWKIYPSEWDLHFCPVQKIEEITKVNSLLFKNY